MQELAMLGLVRPTLPVASWLMPRRRGHHDQAHRLLCLLPEHRVSGPPWVAVSPVLACRRSNRGLERVDHRSSYVFSKGQTLCLVNSVFDGNREFPSIATKTRPTNDALMGYSVDVT
jgi:hypothetical protein